MNDSEYSRILDLYAYDADDQALFPEIGLYTGAIALWLRDHRLGVAQIFRYMLTGFWVEYRACIHLGRNFHTIPWRELPGGRVRERYETFNFYAGAPIRTTSAYLILMKCRSGSDIQQLASDGLTSFVIEGQVRR